MLRGEKKIGHFQLSDQSIYSLGNIELDRPIDVKIAKERRETGSIILKAKIILNCGYLELLEASLLPTSWS
ncbi:hypothetical protein MKX03_000080 [Papaver bracteatum]|nr:hypothetical protein MKX03_000080 [Papaver bracteatum]